MPEVGSLQFTSRLLIVDGHALANTYGECGVYIRLPSGPQFLSRRPQDLSRSWATKALSRGADALSVTRPIEYVDGSVTCIYGRVTARV